MLSPSSLSDCAGALERMGGDLYLKIARELPHGAVFIVDHGLHYVLAEGAELKAAGFTPEHFKGRTVREAVPPELVDQHEADYRTVLNGGSFSREHEINQRHYHSHGIPLKDEHGVPHLALVVSYDVTERVFSERQLSLLSDLAEIAQSAESMDHVVERIATLLKHRVGRVDCFFADIVQDGPRLVELSRLLHAHGLSGVQELTFLGDELPPRLLAGETAGTARRSGNAFFQALNVNSGVLVPHMLDGRLAGVFGVLDSQLRVWKHHEIAAIEIIAEKAWNAMERCRMIKELQRSDHQKDQLLAVLGHELRSPLSTLNVALSVLKHRTVDDTTLSALTLMERQVKQLTLLADDLLDLSCVVHGKLALRFERFDARDLVADIVEAQRLNAMRKHHTVVFTSSPVPISIDADVAKLTQILTNLINNAIKYTPDYGAISVDVCHNEGMLTIAVADTGIGMAHDTIPGLFDLFAQGKQRDATSRAEGGLGIGLWIAKQLVEMHGGLITATSAGLGQGSTFTVVIPQSIKS